MSVPNDSSLITAHFGTRRQRVIDLSAAIIGSLAVLAALVMIWVLRISVGIDVYVSELGAVGMPTAGRFRTALLLVVGGGALVAYSARGIRSFRPIVRAWTPAVSIWIASGFFFVDSQVPCTYGCPIPLGATFTPQDFVHTLAAVLAFLAACWAMLQLTFSHGQRRLAIFSLTSGIAVAVIAGFGGILSLARFQVAFGSRLELAATTIAIGWLVGVGGVIAGRLVAAGPVPTVQQMSAARGADQLEHPVRELHE